MTSVVKLHSLLFQYGMVLSTKCRLQISSIGTSVVLLALGVIVVTGAIVVMLFNGVTEVWGLNKEEIHNVNK